MPAIENDCNSVSAINNVGVTSGLKLETAVEVGSGDVGNSAGDEQALNRAAKNRVNCLIVGERRTKARLKLAREKVLVCPSIYG